MTDHIKTGPGERTAAKPENGEQSREEFLAALAHELRDPLAPICAGLELLKLVRDKLDPYDEIISMMERQTHQLVTLVDHLLEISHIQRGTLLLRKSKARLGDIIQDAISEARPFIADAGLELSFTQAPKTIYLEADPQRLAQALANLLRGAAKFSRGGGEIRMMVQRQDGEGVITVGYEGKAATETRPETDAGFEQGAGSIKEGASPIGLSLVYSLAQLHGGSLDISRRGHGCTYTLRLPILEIMSADGPASPLSLDGHRVLVVDDNRDAAQMLGKVIDLLGNESRTANNGRAAVEVASSFRPHVILMDLDMPEMDGYQAARLIRRQDWGKTITMVALTGWGQEEDRERSVEAGFDSHLLKPVEPYELHRILSRVKKYS